MSGIVVTVKKTERSVVREVYNADLPRRADFSAPHIAIEIHHNNGDYDMVRIPLEARDTLIKALQKC